MVKLEHQPMYSDASPFMDFAEIWRGEIERAHPDCADVSVDVRDYPDRTVCTVTATLQGKPIKTRHVHSNFYESVRGGGARMLRKLKAEKKRTGRGRSQIPLFN